MNQEQILKVEGISLITKITKQVILDDISLTIFAGDCVAIMGSSGAGKTSLLKILNCLQSPTSGNLFLNNINYRNIPVIQLRQNIVYVPQEPKLLEMKVKDALIYPLLLQQLPNIEIKERLDYWREQFKISQDLLERKENQLSLGQRQIITLARALMMKPKLLLLDEPNSALDQGKTDNLLSILHSLSQGEKVPILLISHQFNFVQDFAQKVIYLQQGKILENNLISEVNWPSLQERLKLNNETEFDF
jgi:D-methionine transport system ATP-binding protein